MRKQRTVARRDEGRGSGFMLAIGMAYAGLLLWAISQTLLPWWILPVSFLLNLLTFWMYWADKRAAQAGQWRTPESTLQLLALAGGWPGAWLAQQVLRHKSSKPSFRMVYGLMVLAHGLLLGAWLFGPLFRKVLAAWL